MNAAIRENGGDTDLVVAGVAVKFGGLVAISNMTFKAKARQVTSLIGPNGAGKTTAFNVITGYQRPSAGTVTYRGVSMNGRKPHEIASLGLVRTFQRTSVFAGNTVLNNVKIGLHRKSNSSLLSVLFSLGEERASEAAITSRAWEILAFVGIDHRAHENAAALAYGEQRLLGVALALAGDPSMLLLDEPVSGMNPTETANFLKVLRALRDQHIGILLVEHDMPLVMDISDHVVVLNYGRIIAEGNAAEIQQNPDVITAYLGAGGVVA
jgi:branched-chain amino acid transport system ATP-binding protein